MTNAHPTHSLRVQSLIEWSKVGGARTNGLTKRWQWAKPNDAASLVKSSNNPSISSANNLLMTKMRPIKSKETAISILAELMRIKESLDLVIHLRLPITGRARPFTSPQCSQEPKFSRKRTLKLQLASCIQMPLCASKSSLNPIT